MITLTNFKRKFEKMGYPKDYKDGIYYLRNQIQNSPNKTGRVTETNRNTLRSLLGGTQAKSTASLQERLDNYKSSKIRIPKTKETSNLNIDDIKSSNKPKLKLGNKTKLAIATGALGVGAGIAAINKLRKSRSDKGTKRGSYNT